MTRAASLLIVCLCITRGPEAQAHYHILLPDRPSAKKGQTVTFLFQWGHPFEHQLFDAALPAALQVTPPTGSPLDCKARLEATLVPGGEAKKVQAFRFHLTPDERGDYRVLLRTPPTWMAEENEFWQDTVKVTLHVQVQNGWDQPAQPGAQAFELIPLTRPYGLQPGMVVQVRALFGGKPLAGSPVEIERYHATPPRVLPEDEQITRVVKTDPNGIATCTLAESGWWCLTAQREAGTALRNGKPYPLRQRSTLWIFVDRMPTANRELSKP